MASAATSGYRGLLQVSWNSGASWTTITEQTEASLTINKEQVQSTNKTSSGSLPIHNEYITVALDWSMTVTCNWIDDAVHAGLATMCFADTTASFRFFAVDGAGNDCFLGIGAISRMTPSAPLKDVSRITYEIASRGALTLTTQST